MARSKREYSRGGCRECKRRKIKCDETKPHCLKCMRLDKQCSYPKQGETVLRVLKQYMSEHAVDELKSNINIQYYNPEVKKTQKTPPKRELHRTDEAKQDHDAHIHGNSFKRELEPTISPQVFSELSPSLLFSQDDLQLLVTDVNCMVLDLIPQNIVSIDDIASLWELPHQLTLPSVQSSFINGVPSEYMTPLALDVERKYMKFFYQEFAMQICPFGVFDPANGGYGNPLRDCLLRYGFREAYLLLAILALGAKCEFEELEKAQGATDLIEEARDASWKYLNQCLKLLGPALILNQEQSVRHDMLENLELILLTVLLLALANALLHRQNWRPHLKGAKDIIIKATNLKIRQLKTLILCKMWFVDFEILAGTLLALGGTLSTDFELDSVILFSNSYEIKVLRELGIIQENGFNVISGYHYEAIEWFKELLKMLNKRKQEGAEYIANDLLAYLDFITAFNQFYHTAYVNHEGLLPVLFVLTYIGPPPNLVDLVRGQNSEGEDVTVVVLWMDISQQAYSLAAIIAVHTWILNLPYDMPYIQLLVAKLINLVGWLSRFNDECPSQYHRYLLLMIQWPMIIAGICSDDEDHQMLLLKYFTYSQALGSFLAEKIRKRLVEMWDRRRQGLSVNDDVIDVLAY